MAISSSHSMMIVAKYSSMAAPVVNCTGKSSRSFSVRSDLSCRAVDKIEATEISKVREPYVPVYAKLSDRTIHCDYGLSSSSVPELKKELSLLKSMNVDGVKVECWWSIVEPVPTYYDWFDYRALFQIVRDFNLKLQVVLCFHTSGDGDSIGRGQIPLPYWVMQVGRRNPDIFFTRRNGIRNTDCLTWGIDEEPVLMNNRTASEVYRDFMISFREEFKEFLVEGFISNIEIGLGPLGELRIPSHVDTITTGPGLRVPPSKVFQGEFPPIDEFQLYDKYMTRSLKKAWKERGNSLCGVRPTTGSYSSSQQDTKSCSFFGRFFLQWYSRVLVDHADKLLSLGEDAFSGYCSISAKIPEICHLWYEPSVDVEGVAPIISVLKKYKTTISSTVPEMRSICHFKDFPEALANEIGMGWQLMYAAGDAGIPVSVQDTITCYQRQKEGYEEILEIVKPIDDPIGRHASSFTYLSSLFMEKCYLNDFRRFVQRMHGEFNA